MYNFGTPPIGARAQDLVRTNICVRKIVQFFCWQVWCKHLKKNVKMLRPLEIVDPSTAVEEGTVSLTLRVMLPFLRHSIMIHSIPRALDFALLFGRFSGR